MKILIEVEYISNRIIQFMKFLDTKLKEMKGFREMVENFQSKLNDSLLSDLEQKFSLLSKNSHLIF